MRKLLFLLPLTIGAASNPSEDNGRSTLRGDIVGSVLSTAYQGDTVKAAESMAGLAGSYHQFLSDLQREPFCERASHGENSCARFLNSEVTAIQKQTWSRMYGLAEAAFSGRTATYNFVRDLEVQMAKSCIITMQLSVDLDGQQILNNEFFTRCQ